MEQKKAELPKSCRKENSNVLGRQLSHKPCTNCTNLYIAVFNSNCRSGQFHDHSDNIIKARLKNQLTVPFFLGGRVCLRDSRSANYLAMRNLEQSISVTENPTLRQILDNEEQATQNRDKALQPVRTSLLNCSAEKADLIPLCRPTKFCLQFLCTPMFLQSKFYIHPNERYGRTWT